MAHDELPYILYDPVDDDVSSEDEARDDKLVSTFVARLEKHRLAWKAAGGTHAVSTGMGSVSVPLECTRYIGKFEWSPWSSSKPILDRQKPAEAVLDDYFLDLVRQKAAQDAAELAKSNEKANDQSTDAIEQDEEPPRSQSSLGALSSAAKRVLSQSSLFGRFVSGKPGVNTNVPKTPMPWRGLGSQEVLSERGVTQMDLVSSPGPPSQAPKLTSFQSQAMSRTSSSQSSVLRQTQFPTQTRIEDEISAFLEEDLMS